MAALGKRLKDVEGKEDVERNEMMKSLDALLHLFCLYSPEEVSWTIDLRLHCEFLDRIG